jgi:hypothetical protein
MVDYVVLKQKAIDKFKKWLVRTAKKELKQQGHRNNGALEESLEAIEEVGDDYIYIRLMAAYYADYVNNGVSKDKIPFSGTTSGKTGKMIASSYANSVSIKSAYIDALTRYAESRMQLTGKAALSAAFAIAKTHKEHGMPSPNSYKYSKTGKRTDWIDEILVRDDNFNEIMKFIDELSSGPVDLALNNLATERAKVSDFD